MLVKFGIVAIDNTECDPCWIIDTAKRYESLGMESYFSTNWDTDSQTLVFTNIGPETANQIYGNIAEWLDVNERKLKKHLGICPAMDCFSMKEETKIAESDFERDWRLISVETPEKYVEIRTFEV